MISRDPFQHIDFQKIFQNIESKNFLRRYPQLLIFALVSPTIDFCAGAPMCYTTEKKQKKSDDQRAPVTRYYLIKEPCH